MSRQHHGRNNRLGTGLEIGRFAGARFQIGRFAMALLIVLGLSASLPAQEWAAKMFKATKYDFGTVAKGSKAVYEFTFENIYEEDVHVVSVKSSCGCTVPTVAQKLLKTWEKSSIVAQLNTEAFLGHKSATITVVLDKPYAAEVQLEVEGNIRGDVAFKPGVVNFGTLNQGESTQRAVNVSYVGRNDWEIVDVRAGSANYEVELEESLRQAGKVEYAMKVLLKSDAPAGYLKDQLTIVTNDASTRTIGIPVEGLIKSPLTVSPSSLTMGIVPVANTATRYLIVRAKKPFRVTNIRCSDPAFQAKLDDETQLLHRIPITYSAPNSTGKVLEKIIIETDLGGGATAECTATAIVQ